MKPIAQMGHDSEFTLARSGQILSALTERVRGNTPWGKYFPDNMNQEIAIKPCSGVDEFHLYTEKLLDTVESYGYDLIFKPVVDYGVNSLSHKKANMSGCNPDMNAYTQRLNIPPDLTKFGAKRSAGAHVHVSGISDLNPYEVIKAMDLFLGIPMLFVEERSDRRLMYGAAGAMRLKPYGIEYRALSNAWIHSERTREYIWGKTILAVSEVRSGFVLPNPQEVQDAINNHDLGLASKLIQQYSLEAI